MPIPPEVLFHRYFQDPARHPEIRQSCKGKQDLGALRPELAAFLIEVQKALNEALGNEKRDVPEHVDHPPFHFDYIEAVVSNALAFRDADYSFIDVTMPLVSTLWTRVLS